MWPDLSIYFASCFGHLWWGLWFEFLVILEVGHPGHLKIGVRVLLCFTYQFVVPRFRKGICTFGEIGNPGNRLLGFLNSLGVGGVLRLGYVGDLLFCYQCFRGDHSDQFLEFLAFLFIRKIELGEGRVVAKESHSFIWWVAIVNPGKEVWDETMPSL